MILLIYEACRAAIKLSIDTVTNCRSGPEKCTLADLLAYANITAAGAMIVPELADDHDCVAQLHYNLFLLPKHRFLHF